LEKKEGKVSLENSTTLLAAGVVEGCKLKLVDVVAKAQKKAAQEMQRLELEQNDDDDDGEEEEEGGGEKKKKKKSAGGGGGAGKPAKTGKAPQSREDRFVLAEKKLPEATVRQPHFHTIFL
jgi:hypothetical protein